MKLFQRNGPKDDEKTQTPTEAEVVEHNGDVKADPEEAGTNLDASEPEQQYVTGLKLWSELAALVLIFFLVLLDMSIVATVSGYRNHWEEVLIPPSGYSQDHFGFQLPP
jgi:hypothetical protein